MSELTPEAINQIENRLASYFNIDCRIVFWEDERGEYATLVDKLNVRDATVLDVTGNELDSKRTVLRREPNSNFVLYRSGVAPSPLNDFLYDIKCAATPFTVDESGMWAEQCNINPTLASSIAIHKKFFASKERISYLANSMFSKNTPVEVEFAMLATFTKSNSTTELDVIRDLIAKLIIEFAEDKDNTYKLITECGLEVAFWSYVKKYISYQPSENPTIADLAYLLLLRDCSELIDLQDNTLSYDALRILHDIKTNQYHKDAYSQLVEMYKEQIIAIVSLESISLAIIGKHDTIPAFDEWALDSLSDALLEKTLSRDALSDVISTRQEGYWFGKYKNYYSTIEAFVEFETSHKLFVQEFPSVTGAKQLFDSYCNSWYLVDAAYRHLVDCYTKLASGRFKNKIVDAYAEALNTYDTYLLQLTEKWQLSLLADDKSFPPSDIAYQRDFYKDNVARSLPAKEKGRKVAVIISDGLRYEVGQSLVSQLNQTTNKKLRGKTEIECKGALSMLPSYTQLGMAALLPEGKLSIDINSGNVTKDGAPTAGMPNRCKILVQALSDSIAVNSNDVINGEARGQIAEAPLIYVYQNKIDHIGDDRQTENELPEACVNACNDIENLCVELLNAGCGEIFITADHGFIYQAGDIESYNYAEVQDLSVLNQMDGFDINYTRRHIIAESIPTNDMLIEYSACKFGLETDANIAFTKGVCRLRLRGSGARYVHGGVSLQENVIPIVKVKAIKGAKAATTADVSGYAVGQSTGRYSIAGAGISLDVFQVDPCSASIMPVDIKVGLYAPDSKLLSTQELKMTLDSESEQADERKTRVDLNITNDIDDYEQAILKISKRIGDTNSYSSAWEQTYSVNRGFGNDF